MKVLQVHCTYKYKGGEDSVVANERDLLRQSGVVVEELTFTNELHTIPKVLQTVFNLKAYYTTGRKIKAFKPDIVHIHNLHFAASPSVIIAIHNSGIPFVQTLHNYRLICPSGVLFYEGKLFLKSLTQKFPWAAVKAGVYKDSKMLTGWLAFSNKFHQWISTWQKADRYIVLTHHAEKVFLSSQLVFKKGQLVIKPNFSLPPGNISGVTPADHFVFIGRLSQEKGIDVLLKAFASLPYKLKIAGDGPMLKEVLAVCNDNPNIEYLGSLSRDAIFSFLSEAAAMIFPSVWYEGMPMVMIEAFACGLPVIASRLGAMEEMITSGYNGLHFEAGQVTALQSAVIQYQHLSQDEKNRYRQNALHTYHNLYTPEINARQLLNIYTDVIDAATAGTTIQTQLPAESSSLSSSY